MSKRFTTEELDFIKKYYPEYGSKFCAEKLGRSQDSIQSKASRLKIKRNKEITLDGSNIEFKSSFRTLKEAIDLKDKKELFYFLGYFWADGYIRKDNGLVLEINSEDGKDIYPILNNICDWKIYRRKRHGRNEVIIYYVKDREVAELFRSLGKYPKSIESHKKILDWIPEEMKLYFLRGFIDGDGCFYISNSVIQFNISSNFNQDWSAISEYLKKFGLTTLCEHKRDHNNKNKKSYSSYIRSSNRHELVEFFNKLYCLEDGIYLKRKYNKIKPFLKN